MCAVKTTVRNPYDVIVPGTITGLYQQQLLIKCYGMAEALYLSGHHRTKSFKSVDSTAYFSRESSKGFCTTDWWIMIKRGM